MTDEREPLRYDEAALSGRLKELPLSERVLFACACAERLMLSYRWFCERSDLDDFGFVRDALDAAWLVDSSASAAPPEISAWRERVEALVRDTADEEMFVASAVAQNAVAGVGYALRAWETAGFQEAVFAARQLYEAADVVVQQGAPSQSYVEVIDLEAPAQLILRGIDATLHDLATLDAKSLVVKAEADGEVFLTYVAGLAED